MRIRAKARPLAALVAGAVALVSCVYAAIALGDVIVYSNTLSSPRHGNELHHFEGKASNCSRHVRKGSLLIKVTGKDVCGYRLPLEGDKPQPDQSLHARVKLGKQTPKELRGKSFLGVAVRYGGGTGYTLRVLPTRHQFALRRLPKEKGFNAGGKEPKIKGLNKWNDIRLQAIGSKVTAVINGKTVASVTDSNPKGVTGRKAEIFAGANKANPVGASGRVDDVRLTVPSP